ncbi:hypothetical protein ACVWYN_001827 [Pedobacter sp. UYP24]
MRKVLLSLLLIASAIGCKKENQNAQISIIGTSWENSSFPNGGSVVLNERLEFVSATEVVFYNTFTSDRLMTAQGRSKLSFTIDDTNYASPKIHVMGKLNSVSGNVGQGAVADLTLTYTRGVGSADPTLSDGDGKIYKKVVYK